VAEYTAVLRALALAEELGARDLELLLDSKLIVEQLHGRWRVKDAKLIPLNAETRTRLTRFGKWTATHVPRAQNKQADALCNDAIDRAQAGGQWAVVVRP
jgi:probable phosphoglycerate mutase